jgi:hypothetical protein
MGVTNADSICQWENLHSVDQDVIGLQQVLFNEVLHSRPLLFEVSNRLGQAGRECKMMRHVGNHRSQQALENDMESQLGWCLHSAYKSTNYLPSRLDVWNLATSVSDFQAGIDVIRSIWTPPNARFLVMSGLCPSMHDP